MLPEKPLSAASGSEDRLRRLSTGALMPGSSYRWSGALPYYHKTWQNFGAQLLFGQNFDRYLWTSVCCPCYVCQPFQFPYTYSFSHYSSQYCPSQSGQAMAIEMTAKCQKLDHVKSSSQEGTRICRECRYCMMP
jgi:hypothetical protein